MKTETMAETGLDRVAIAAAVAALFGRPVRIERVEARPDERAEIWVREGRLAVQSRSRSLATPVGREWPR